VSILLWALAGLSLVLGVLLVSVLVLPVQLIVRAQSAPARLRVGLGLLGGIVPVWSLIDTDRPALPDTPQPETSVPETPAETPDFAAMDRARAMRLLRATPRFLRAGLGQIRVESCRGTCRFGFDDPAETGQLYGYLIPLTLPLRDRLRLDPDFTRACLVADLDCRLSVVPVRLLGPVLRFGWAGFGPRRAVQP
jgi:hypothetical protein